MLLALFCARAGSGINMIHHYFGSKRGLLDAIVDLAPAPTPRLEVRLTVPGRPPAWGLASARVA